MNLFGNRYEVDPALVGRRVELVFDAFDLSHVEVRFEGRSMGEAVAHVTRRHSHPRALEDPTPPAEPSGIDYLGLVTARHREALEERIAYLELPEGAFVDAEQVVVEGPATWDLANDQPIEDNAIEEEGR